MEAALPSAMYLRREEYEVRDVAQSAAEWLVERYHYAGGGPNTGVFRHGLFLRGGEHILGVAWWLPPTKRAAESVAGEDWRRVLALSRLVIAPNVPTNGASFLLGQSIRRVRADGRWSTLVTYADEGEGHTGAIYKATNWVPDGVRRGHSTWVVPTTGRRVAIKAGNRTRTRDEMLALGLVNLGPSRKRRFVMKLR